MKARCLLPVTLLAVVAPVFTAAGLTAQEPVPEAATVRRAVADLASLSQTERDAAVEVLVAAGPRAIEPIRVLLDDDGTGTVARSCAWVVLRRIAPHATPLRELLLDIVDRDRFGARRYAAEIVAAIDLEGAQAIASRAAGLQMNAQNMRMALESAAWRGAEPAIEALVPLFLNEIIGYRGTVDSWLLRLGRHADTDATGRALGRLIAASDSTERRMALAALGRIGVHAAPATSQLLDALATERDAEARSQIVTALRQAGPEALPAIHAAAAKAGPFRRALLLRALGGHGMAALPAMIESLADDDAAVRFAAVKSCQLLGKNAVPALGEALRDPARRLAAVEALRRIGPPARETLDALRTLSGVDDRELAACARRAVEAIAR